MVLIMAYGKYIKVKLPTGEEAVVMTALLPFYASQKANISEPSEEEVLAAFPEERMLKKAEGVKSFLKERIAELEQERQALLKEKAELESQIARLTEEATKKDKSTKSK